MKGLQVDYNNKQTIVGQTAPNEVITLVISIGKNESSFRLDVGGYNPAEDTHFDWIKEDLTTTNRVTINFFE